MTDIATLRALLERVEKANGRDRELDFAVALMEGWTLTKMKGDARAYWREPGETKYYMRKTDGPPRYSSSVDDALSLIERLLTGWVVELAYHHSTSSAALHPYEDTERPFVGIQRTAPLALLDAMLQALITQAEAP